MLSRLDEDIQPKLIAVNNVNLKVEESSIYGFLGSNGAGKQQL
ncbi:hypothetical protein DRO29_06640 [Candidatus Bathyarchaeota archaeon]|nr:MAG: hypothetical protein DRO29_06640 [Candidatus Bathyarchaeota archaeon]